MTISSDGGLLLLSSLLAADSELWVDMMWVPPASAPPLHESLLSEEDAMKDELNCSWHLLATELKKTGIVGDPFACNTTLVKTWFPASTLVSGETSGPHYQTTQCQIDKTQPKSLQYKHSNWVRQIIFFSTAHDAVSIGIMSPGKRSLRLPWSPATERRHDRSISDHSVPTLVFFKVHPKSNLEKSRCARRRRWKF